MAQLSDRKYKSMMRMIDVALPKFDDNPKDDVSSHPIAQPMRHTSTFAQARAAEEEEIEHHLDEQHSDEEDGKEEDAEAGEKDEFFDTPDISDGVSLAILYSAEIRETYASKC